MLTRVFSQRKVRENNYFYIPLTIAGLGIGLNREDNINDFF